MPENQIVNPENQTIDQSLLIPKPRRKINWHLFGFFAAAIVLHILLYFSLKLYAPTLLKKSIHSIRVHMLQIIPPKPKPKPPPPPKPKPKPKPKLVHHPKPMAAPPKLRLHQIKFHVSKKTFPSLNSNLIEVHESRGGSTYGSPTGVIGGKGNIHSTGRKKVLPSPPPPPPPPKPVIPNRKFPEVISKCAPHYPSNARDEGVQGTVWLLVLVGKQGQILNVTVSRSSGDPDLDDAALEAVQQCWQFAPAVEGGKPVKASLTFPIRFRLNG